MSRQIDTTKPLSEEDEKYLAARNRHDLIAWANNREEVEAQQNMSPEEVAEMQRKADEEAAGQRTPALMDNSIIQAQQDEIERTRQEGEAASAEVYGPYSDYDPDDVAYVQQCTNEELKDQLKQRNKPTSGNKAELQVRLLDALKDESESNEGDSGN